MGDRAVNEVLDIAEKMRRIADAGRREDEIARLRAERDEALAANSITVEFWTAATEERDEARAEAERLRKALRPLANMDARLPDGGHSFDQWPADRVVFSIGQDRRITVGDLRRARATIKETSND